MRVTVLARKLLQTWAIYVCGGTGLGPYAICTTDEVVDRPVDVSALLKWFHSLRVH
jgi:hypothetical protein